VSKLSRAISAWTRLATKNARSPLLGAIAAVAVAPEGGEQLVHFGLGQVLADPGM